jgi:GNAT superfamily N-acetyltransferase
MTEGGLAIGALQIVVYVEPRFRRQGVAAALLAHARRQFSSVVHSDDLSPAGAGGGRRTGRSGIVGV